MKVLGVNFFFETQCRTPETLNRNPRTTVPQNAAIFELVDLLSRLSCSHEKVMMMSQRVQELSCRQTDTTENNTTSLRYNCAGGMKENSST